MPQNAHEVSGYREFWEARGAEVKVRPMLEWTATGTVRTDTIVHDDGFPDCLPVGQQHDGHSPGRSVVACAVDYEGRFKAGNLNEITVKEAWAALGEQLRKPIASTAGTTFPISARAVATGRSPAPNTRRRKSKARGRSGTTSAESHRARLMSEPRSLKLSVRPCWSATTRRQYGLRPEASQYPMMLVLSFAYPCNALCPHCPYTNSNIRKEYRDAPYMPEAIFKKIADESGPHRAYLRISGGGEPMLHPKATELLVYAKSKGCKIGLITNGSLFDRGEFPRAARGRRRHDRVLRRRLRPGNLRHRPQGPRLRRAAMTNFSRMIGLRNEISSTTKIVGSAVNQSGVDIAAVETLLGRRNRRRLSHQAQIS